MSKKIAIIIILFFTVFLVTPVLAQDIGISDTLKTISDTGGYKIINDETFLDTFIGQRIAMILSFVGLLFLGLTIFSGFQWMGAGGNEEAVTKAKKRIIGSVIGVGIVVFAFVISNAVFNFFYDQSGRNIAEQPEENWLGNECDENSDCPATQPICEQFGLWRWCTCTSDQDCQELTATPYCWERNAASNICSECTEHGHCGDMQAPNIRACIEGSCYDKECLTDTDCTAPNTHCLNSTPLFVSGFNYAYTCVECYDSNHCVSDICNLLNFTCALQ